VIEDHVLMRHEGNTDPFCVLWPYSDKVAAGNADPGVNLHCSGCGIVLAQAVYSRQFLDVLFRCSSCGALSASPKRKPSEPLTHQSSRCILRPGRHPINPALDLTDKPIMIAGQQALDGYLNEVGQKDHGSFDLSDAHLNNLVAKATGWLGDNYQRLRASDRLGLASSTQPPHRHRLIELIDYAEDAARALKSHKPGDQLDLDGPKITELHGLIGLLDRWKNHHALRKLVADLSSETAVHHTLLLLAVASYLCDAGNGVGLFSEESATRVADLWLEESLTERLEVEVKTPMAFRGPLSSLLAEDAAYDVISRHANKAASASSGQLNPDHSGVIAFGAFHLEAKDIETLISASKRYLKEQYGQRRKTHLAGITVTSLGFTRTMTTASPSIETHVIPHAGYLGSLTFEPEPPLR
jgi:hypothetical protein